ncbi:metal ABC transporter substrate-binding protein [Bacteroidota bacterium]
MKKAYLIFFSMILLVFNFEIFAQELYVVTTIPSLASIAEEIGGDNLEVYSITRGVQDAHYIEAKPSYMLKLNKADLLIYSGLELEIGWLPLLIQGARNYNVAVGSPGNLNASLAMGSEDILEKPRGEVDRSMGDVHPSGNPHYLLNPQIGLKVAGLITDKLIELDPDNTEDYLNNLHAFENKINAKIVEWAEKTLSIKGKEVVCYHVHWSYLLNWLELINGSYIELRPGIPPTPRHKMQIIQLMKNRSIEVVIISSWKEPSKAREVANAVGAELIILPGEVNAMEGAEDYISWIDFMVNKICDAFYN